LFQELICLKFIAKVEQISCAIFIIKLLLKGGSYEAHGNPDEGLPFFCLTKCSCVNAGSKNDFLN